MLNNIFIQRFLVIIFILYLNINNIYSIEIKDITISGIVKSTEGEIVDFATVYLKDTLIGTVTDINGRYSLKVKSGKYVLVVSAVGYETVVKNIDTLKGDCKYDLIVKPSVTELYEVTVVAKSESRKEREKGFAISAINTKKASFGNLQTSELLNRVSGVKLRQSGGVGSNIQYNINGMSGNSIRIFIDGIPMGNYGSSFSVSSLPPSMIERIDIYKGVVPAHLTDDALGGAINIILKQPSSKSISTSYTYGSFNTHKWDLNANFRDAKSGFTVQGAAFFNHSDNNYKVWGDPVKITDPQNGKVERIKAERFHDAYTSKGVTINTGFTKVKWADRFLLGFIYSDMGKDIQHGATMEVVYGNRNSSQHTYMGKMQYDKRDLLPNLDISANFTFAKGRRLVTDTVPYMYNWLGEIMTDRNGNPVVWNKGGGEAGKATLATNIEGTKTGRMRLSYRIVPSQVLSANVLYNAFTRDVKDPYLTEAEQRFTDTRYMNKTILSFDYDGKYFDDRLHTSLFYKHYHQSVKLSDPVLKDGEIVSEKISRAVSDNGFGGAVSFRIVPELMLTTSAEHATRLPGVTELLGNSTNNIQTSYELRPEKSTNINVGAIIGPLKLGKHSLETDINLFYRDIKDMIQKSLTNLTDEMYGYENLGKILSKGVDLDIRYNYDHRLMSEFNLSYTDARFNLRYDKHGTEYLYYKDRLRNDPFFTTNWNVEYIAENWLQRGSRISFTYNMGYVHEFFRNWESLGGAGKAVIPSQMVHDLGVVYYFPKRNLSLSTDVKNLLNEQVFDNWALQKPGRMFFVKVTYSFTK